MVDRPCPKTNGLLSSAAWNMLSLGVLAVAGFITMPIIIKGVGTENYGLYSIILMIGGFVALQDLGLGEATLRFVSKYYVKKDLVGINRVFGATLSVYLLTGSLCCISVIVFAPKIITIFKMQADQVADGVLSLRIASIGFLFSTIATAMQKIPEALLRYDIASKVGIVLSIVRCVLMVVIVKLGYGIVGLVWLLMLHTLLTMFIYGIISCRLITGLHFWPHFELAGIREVFSYGIFSFANAMIGNTALYIDRFILGVFFGAAEVAYLTAPKDLIARVSGVPAAAGKALFPRFSRMDDASQEACRIYVDSTWLLLCFSLVLFIPLTIILPEFLALWISPEFSRSSVSVARLIAISSSVLGVSVPYFAYLKGSGRIHWLTTIFLISTGLSIIAAVFLIKVYGLLGAGYRVCLLSWTSVLISIIVLKKGLNPPFLGSLVFRSMLLPIFLSTTFAWPCYRMWEAINCHGWIAIVLGYSVMGGLLTILLVGADLLFYKGNGTVGPMLKKDGLLFKVALYFGNNGR